MERRVVKSILLTPLERLEGLKVKRYIGLVRSLIVDNIPPHVELKGLVERKHPNSYSLFISSLVHRALEDLEDKAKYMGGNAVLGLRIEIESLGWGRVVIHAYGTVVEVEESE